jgi:hypothetical protein
MYLIRSCSSKCSGVYNTRRPRSASAIFDYRMMREDMTAGVDCLYHVLNQAYRTGNRPARPSEQGPGLRNG